MHLLVSLHPSIAVSQLVKELKVSTTPFARAQLKIHDFAWQDGYGAFTLRDTECDIVRRYILDQEAHHATGSLVDPWETSTCNPADAG